MAAMHDARRTLVGPIAMVFLAGSLSLFLGAALSDVAYARTYEIQWANFASWLLVGALLFAGAALAIALRDGLSPRRRTRALMVFTLVLALAWIVGFTSALTHARDAWASMPGGLIQSCLAFVLVVVATFLAVRHDASGANP